MEEILKFAQKKGASYIEILKNDKLRNVIDISNKEIKDMSSGSSKLYAIRLMYKKKLGLAYSYNFDLKKLVEKAIKNAKANDTKINFGTNSLIKKKFKTKCKINPLDISLEQKKKDLDKLDIRKDFIDVKSLRLAYGDTCSKLSFYNSEGSEIEWKDYNTGIIMWPFAKKGSNMQNFIKIERIKGGYEVMDKARISIKVAMKKATDLLKAKFAKGGVFPTIVDYKLGGVFCHEAVGHACEADHIIINSSILKGKMNAKVGADVVNIADDGSLKTWGWTPFDSEGLKASKTQLIKNGVLVGWLHSRETAGEFGEEPTGNGRAQTLSDRVIPRMTTTFIESGDASFEEMLDEIKEGYYLKGSLGGEVDPASGEFLFNAQEGYYVKKGEIKHMVKGVSLTGNILKTLHNIKLVGKNLDFGHGFCGKGGQHVPVSEGSPDILIDNAKIGGSL